MTSAELYLQVLGIQAPWHVAQVKLNQAQQIVEVSLEHAKGARWKCSVCEEWHATATAS